MAWCAKIFDRILMSLKLYNGNNQHYFVVQYMRHWRCFFLVNNWEKTARFPLQHCEWLDWTNKCSVTRMSFQNNINSVYMKAPFFQWYFAFIHQWFIQLDQFIQVHTPIKICSNMIIQPMWWCISMVMGGKHLSLVMFYTEGNHDLKEHYYWYSIPISIIITSNVFIWVQFTYFLFN